MVGQNIDEDAGTGLGRRGIRGRRLTTLRKAEHQDAGLGNIEKIGLPDRSKNDDGDQPDQNVHRPAQDSVGRGATVQFRAQKPVHHAAQNAIGKWVDPPATPDKVLKALGKA